MRSLREFSRLLEGARNGDLLALVAALGFPPPSPIDAPARRSLGIPAGFARVLISRGPGALRVLTFAADPGVPIRNQLSRLAGLLSARAPHFLWLAVGSDAVGRTVALSAWDAGAQPARVSSLVVASDPLESDAETLGALVDATGASDLLVHSRWCEILGRDALCRRFYHRLEHAVLRLADGSDCVAPTEDRRELALFAVSRLIFLSFLETRGWLDGDRGFLARHLERCLAAGGALHRTLLNPLFFGTLNTRMSRRAPLAKVFGRVPFLNGGLFTRAPKERRWRAFAPRDEDVVALFDEVLFRYRFTPREDDGRWSEAAIDPEMLGRAFESLMASTERRASGTFYTPQALVEQVSEAALRDALDARGVSEATFDRGWRGGSCSGTEARALGMAVSDLRILDPACGSGAFLVYALERLSVMAASASDTRPEWIRRREIVTRSIFGVDVNPVAVWLCEMRLWLSVLLDCDIDEPMRVPPLPNLDHNIRIGDSLSGGGFEAPPDRGASALSVLRSRYACATGARKQTLGRALDRAERDHAMRVVRDRLVACTSARRELLAAARGPDLFGGRRGLTPVERDALNTVRGKVRSLRRELDRLRDGHAPPFVFAAHFADVAARGGFDVVIGNPPWVRLHRIPSIARDQFRREFRVAREAAWMRGAIDARAGRGFAAQIDLSALFAERAMSLATVGATVALLLPAKLWRSLAGGGVRRLFGDWNELRRLEDWTNAAAVFDAAVYPALVVARRGAPRTKEASCIGVAVHRRELTMTWRVPPESVSLDESPGAPWVVLPPDARAAFDRMMSAGVPLADSGLGHPTLGVKCGCNDAFIVTVLWEKEDRARISDGRREGEVERSALRPVLRGEDVAAARPAHPSARLIYPHDASGLVWAELPPLLRAWMHPWRRRLGQRADARTASARWWTVFRTESAVSTHPRVVWADMGKTPSAIVLRPGDGTVPLNSCYVLRARDDVDAWALAALLNSPLSAAWLGTLAEPARGGYRRFLAWTVARLPVPRDWARARDILAPAGHAHARQELGSMGLLETTLSAYRLRHATLAPLLEWEAR